jgi:hypothetical protein
MSVPPAESPRERPATRRALGARSRAPMVWIGIAASIALVFLIAFTLAAIL